MKNESALERVIRFFAGLLFLMLGFFWLGGVWSLIAYAFGVVLLVTALIGFCPLYKLFNLSTTRENNWTPGKLAWVAIAAGAVVLLIGGSYASNFFTKKFYLEDFNQMNNYYKQALFQTGQGNRPEAIANYEQLVTEYADFQTKYNTYRPYALKGDGQFETDLARVSTMIMAVDQEVHQGDLTAAHLALEEVRPVFQDIFKRNNFSMLAVTLVDFHDVMELVLEAANEKDPQQVLAAYAEADAKLKAVEAEANDAEIQVIRQNLEAVRSLAENGAVDQLPEQSNALKSSFVKVYLKRG